MPSDISPGSLRVRRLSKIFMSGQSLITVCSYETHLELGR